MIVAAGLLLLVASPGAIRADDDALPPASEAAILAGASACVGATIDPAGQDARLVGWTLVTGGHKDATERRGAIDARIATRDGVRLTVKTGIDGGCVVQAKGDAAFAKPHFLAALSARIGVVADGTREKVDLPNGELMVVQVGGQPGKIYVQLVVANPNGQRAKKYKGK